MLTQTKAIDPSITSHDNIENNTLKSDIKQPISPSSESSHTLPPPPTYLKSTVRPDGKYGYFIDFDLPTHWLLEPIAMWTIDSIVTFANGQKQKNWTTSHKIYFISSPPPDQLIGITFDATAYDKTKKIITTAKFQRT
jgi:hypothetical protein